MEQQRDLPLGLVTLILGALSVPLAFAVHLVSLALVLGALAVVLGLWGRWMQGRHPQLFKETSLRRSRLGLRLGAIGLASSVVMLILWATNVLL